MTCLFMCMTFVNVLSGKMEEENKNLYDISKRLEIDDTKVINKASEHLRLLKVKSTALKISEYAKTVICLEIAATNTNAPFNPETALSFLNYGRSKYRKEKNIVERILNINQIADVKSICSSMKVANNKDLEKHATEFLEQFKLSKGISDEHPQYDAMAVYQTCKMMKIKVKEDKLIDVSHLNRAQWTNLKNVWQRWSDENKINLKANPKKKGSSNDELEMTTETKENLKPKRKIEEETESYEDWKRRILSKAYADLKSRNLKCLQ